MLSLSSDEFVIQVRDEPDYNSHSTDNLIHYQKVFDFSGEHSPSSQHSVHVYRDGQLRAQAIILGSDGATTIHKHSAIVHDGKIFLCCGNRVCCLSLVSLDLVWSKEIDKATASGIYKRDEVILVRGEMELSRIDATGAIIWTFSGADIFVDHSGPDSFVMHESYFDIQDFSENQYRISYDGQQIKHSPSKGSSSSNNLPFIRDATTTDITRLHVIRTSVRENVLSNPALISPADYGEFLIARGKGWVAEIDHTIVGFAICDLKDENIWALFVHPGFEGRGVARALQKEMLDWYFTQRDKVWLGTAPGTRAEAFYRKSGWRENGTHGKEVKFEMTKEEWTRNCLKMPH